MVLGRKEKDVSVLLLERGKGARSQPVRRAEAFIIKEMIREALLESEGKSFAHYSDAVDRVGDSLHGGAEDISISDDCEHKGLLSRER